MHKTTMVNLRLKIFAFIEAIDFKTAGILFSFLNLKKATKQEVQKPKKHIQQII